MKQPNLTKEDWIMIHYALMATAARKLSYYNEYNKTVLADQFKAEWQKWDNLAEKVKNETT